MNVQEMLTNWRNIINTEKTNAQSEKRDSVVNTEFEQLLTIAETQNACIKAMRKGKTAEELETWLIEPNKLLDNKSPLETIDTGEAHKVYDII
jgi:uncharacterized protein (DUF2384 family)